MTTRSIEAMLVLLVLSGCSRYRAPSVIVSEARLVEETDDAIKLEFAIDLENPNDTEMPLRYFEYSASLDGRARFRGKRAAEATIPAHGNKRLTVPGVFRRGELGFGVAEAPSPIGYAIQGQLYYEAPGQLAEILLDTKLRRPKKGFSDTGALSLAVE